MNFAAIISMQQEVTLALIILLMLVADLFVKESNSKILRVLAYVLLVVQIAVNIVPAETSAFEGMYHSTQMASVVKTILSLGTLLVFMQADKWLGREDTSFKTGEFYILTLSTLLGMFFMVSAGHFLLFYIGLELASIPMACLVAFDKFRHHSAEAGVKYILNAMFSSGIMLYGISMVYGTCGTLYFADAAAALTGTPLQVLAMVFFFAGLGFKISLVPFHMWTPDTYQGAPTTVTAYLSVISKGAAAFALMSILMKVFGIMVEDWTLLLGIVIVLTITVGNLFAILQKDLKRFMAYSSISQAGYIMLAVMADSGQGVASLVYYVVIYIVANLAVFGVISSIEQHSGGKVERDDYNGLYKTNPRLTFVMTLALFSLAGIPPFAGFFSKFFVFASAFHTGFALEQTGYWVVVFIALVNTIISLYYYLLIVKAMYITPNDNPIPTFKSGVMERAGLSICLAGVVFIGLLSCVYQYLTDTALLS